jgi:hypothetical protein
VCRIAWQAADLPQILPITYSMDWAPSSSVPLADCLLADQIKTTSRWTRCGQVVHQHDCSISLLRGL